MNLIHIVIMKQDILDSIKTWGYTEDDKRGIKAAEAEFRKEILERFPSTTDDDMEDMLDEGYCEGMNFGIFITHSILEEL